jgi:hypothetical protein
MHPDPARGSKAIRWRRRKDRWRARSPPSPLWNRRRWRWRKVPARKPALHVDAAAQAAVLALTKGKPGIYNIAEDDAALSSDKAKRELGFDATFRIKS